MEGIWMILLYMAAAHLMSLYYDILNVFLPYLTHVFMVQMKDKYREYYFMCYNSSKEYFYRNFLWNMCEDGQ